MKKISILRGTAAMVALISCLSCGDAANKGGANGAAKSYKTLTIALSNSSIDNTYSTSIRSSQYVDIRPQVSGVITDILINEGAQISRDQTLFIIDQVPYQASLNVAIANVKSAEAAVATAKLNAEANKELYDEQVISEVEYQVTLNTLLSAEAALVLAEAQQTNAENDLSYTVIKSPVDGVASMINYRIGALVSANSTTTDPLVSVANNDQMHAYFSLSEAQMLSLMREAGSQERLMEEFSHLELVLNDGKKYGQTGEVDAISGTIDRTTGSVRLRALFANPNLVLRDGGSGRIIITTQFNDAIVIPKVATFEVQDQIFAYRVVDGKAKSTIITVNKLNDGRNYIVESGLAVGDEIVAEGAGLLREGTTIVANK